MLYPYVCRIHWEQRDDPSISGAHTFRHSVRARGGRHAEKKAFEHAYALPCYADRVADGNNWRLEVEVRFLTVNDILNNTDWRI